jgi:hypothetical protein
LAVKEQSKVWVHGATVGPAGHRRFRYSSHAPGSGIVGSTSPRTNPWVPRIESISKRR